MRKASFFVIIAIMATAMMFVTGCNTTQEQRFAAYKKVFATVAQVAVTAYNMGGKQLAYAEVDKKVASGDITAAQGDQIKAAADKGVAAMQALATKAAAEAQKESPPPSPLPVTKETTALLSTPYNIKGMFLSGRHNCKMLTHREINIIYLC